MLNGEARALAARLARVKPFGLQETTLPAASIGAAAYVAVEEFLADGRRKLRLRIAEFLRTLQHAGMRMTAEQMQEQFTVLRLQFNILLSQLDIFSDVITQRSEHEDGVRLAGLDVLAADALALHGNYYEPPPLVCYLDRGHGAAIRRARTRLPGGPPNPVGVIRVPRERMVGSGVASSLIHEVGHQGAALIDLVNSIRPLLAGMRGSRHAGVNAWDYWERWISEIVADFWSVATLGIGATVGLMAVVSLPRAFVFRIDEQDPHPTPWIRVKLSCAMGDQLYPHPQWSAFAQLWEQLYPRTGLDPQKLEVMAELEKTMRAFVSLLVHHRPRALRGRSLGEVFPVRERTPERLLWHYRFWRKAPEAMRRARPSLAMAVLAQARLSGGLSPEQESRMLHYLLTYWALQRTLRESAASSAHLTAVARRKAS
jgi:hypothetical protein